MCVFETVVIVNSFLTLLIVLNVNKRLITKTINVIYTTKATSYAV